MSSRDYGIGMQKRGLKTRFKNDLLINAKRKSLRILLKIKLEKVAQENI